MKNNMLSETHAVHINGHGVLNLNAKDFYAQCKEYYNLLGQEIGILPKNSNITEVRFDFEGYNWKPFQKYITMWVFSQDDDGGRSIVSFDLPLEIATGTKTPKECAIMELENNISEYKDDLEALEEDIANTKQKIKKTEKQISKIQNS